MLDVSARTIRRIFITGAATAALLALPVAGSAVFGGKIGSDGTAYAQGQGQGQGGQGQGKGVKGGGHAGSSAATGSGQGGGQGGPPAGKGAGSTSAGGGSDAKMGRLNMARAYLSPGFDATKIDDPEAPLAQLDAYVTSLEDGVKDLDVLATYLSKVATAELSGASIEKLNDTLQVTDLFTATGISADALATKVNELVKENREEETETTTKK